MRGPERSGSGWGRRDRKAALLVQVLHHRRMGLKGTHVYADDEDLCLIKEAAKRLGVSECDTGAVLIRDIRDFRELRPLAGRCTHFRILPDDF